RRPAWNPAGNVIDIALRQFHQRQHLRGDDLAAFWNEVWRNEDPYAATHRGGKTGRRRAGEQRPHIGLQPLPAHLGNHLDRYQGMAAEFEEIILNPDTLET